MFYQPGHTVVAVLNSICRVQSAPLISKYQCPPGPCFAASTAVRQNASAPSSSRQQQAKVNSWDFQGLGSISSIANHPPPIIHRQAILDYCQYDGSFKLQCLLGAEHKCAV